MGTTVVGETGSGPSVHAVYVCPLNLLKIIPNAPLPFEKIVARPAHTYEVVGLLLSNSLWAVWIAWSLDAP